MKTSIINQLKLKAPQTLRQVLPLDESNLVLWIYEGDKSFLKIRGTKERNIRLPSPAKFGWHRNNFMWTNDNSYTSLFSYKNGFGVATSYGKVSLWETPEAHPRISCIKFPFAKEAHYKGFIGKVTYDTQSDSFIVGYCEEVSTWHSKYWAKFSARVGGPLSRLRPLKQMVAPALNLLPIDKFPPSKLGDINHFWLTIKSIGCHNSQLYFHTNGGRSTRSKSGSDFDFSIICEYSASGEWVENHTIEEGNVYFGPDTSQMLLITRNKRKAFIYKTYPFTLEHEISLTVKQNLGDIDSKHLNGQVMGDRLYLWGGNSFTVSQIQND